MCVCDRVIIIGVGYIITPSHFEMKFTQFTASTAYSALIW